MAFRRLHLRSYLAVARAPRPALITLSPLIIRILKIVVPILLGLLLLPILAASAV